MPSYLPLFEFPTHVVLVDDDPDYLRGTAAFLLAHRVRSVSFVNPLEALAYLKKRSYCGFVKAHLGLEDESEAFNKIISINLRSLYKEINNPARFDEITVLVVDYSMPEISGEEFCKQISGLPIQKLLLTAETSYKTVVDLFNNGTIHSFIRKDQSYEVILKEIEKLQNRYFQNITRSLLFALRDSLGTCPFAEEKLINFFRSLCKEYGFVEYYVVDERGSYLLANDSGLSKLLIINSKEDIKSYYEFTEKKKGVSEQLLESLRENKKVTFVQSKSDLMLPIKDWRFYDAIPIEGTHYYYALVDASSHFGFDFLNGIVRYDRCLNQ